MDDSRVSNAVVNNSCPPTFGTSEPLDSVLEIPWKLEAGSHNTVDPRASMVRSHRETESDSVSCTGTHLRRRSSRATDMLYDAVISFT
jgi:hypothetical protein